MRFLLHPFLCAMLIWPPARCKAAASPQCLDAFIAHLNHCVAFVCDVSDPRLDGKTARVQVFGRQNGLCLASGSILDEGTLHCGFSLATVRYLSAPAVAQALRSPNLQTSIRAPESRDDIADALQGHPLIAASLDGHSLDTSGIQHDCTVALR